MKQNLITQLLSITFRILETFAPSLASKLVVWIFFHPVRYQRPQREMSYLEDATVTRVPYSGLVQNGVKDPAYLRYQWGEGPPVLLVHGWSGRATQFTHLIRALVQQGYQVVSFEAPAHGNSPGKQTNLLEFGEIIHELGDSFGEFEAVIGHSLGAVASSRSLLEGLPAKKLVTLGAPSQIAHILRDFAKQVPAGPQPLRHLEKHLLGLAKASIEEFSLMSVLPQLTQPILLIHDQKDRSVGYDQALELSEAVPSAEMMTTERLGHNRLLGDSEVIESILSFLREEE